MMDLKDDRVLISDLRDSNFSIEKGLAMAVSSKETEKDYYEWASQNRDYDTALRERIQIPIEHGLLISGKFDDRKLRYAGHCETNGKYSLKVAPTHFGEFTDIDLRAASDEDFYEDLKRKGLKDYNDPEAYFSNCFAVNAVPILEDGSIVLLKRKPDSDVFPSHWHVIGGMLDSDLTLFSKSDPTKKLIEEIYSTIGNEFVEEASILDSRIRLQGLVKNIPGTCDFSCIADLNLDFDDFVRNSKSAKDASDHTDIVRLKGKQELTDFMAKEKLTDSGFGSLLLYLNSY